MEKKLLSEINRYREIVGLPILNEEPFGGGGEKDAAKFLIDLLFKDEVKSAEKGLFNLEKTTDAGKKQIFKMKPSVVKETMAKDTKLLTGDEKELLHNVGSNMVRVLGADVVADAIIAGSKVIEDIGVRKIARKELIDKYFIGDTKTKVQEEIVDRISSTIINKTTEPAFDPKELSRIIDEAMAKNIPPQEIKSILKPEEIEVVNAEMNDFVKNNVNVETITRVSRDDIFKMGQLQKLKENEVGLKMLENKAAAEKELMALEKQKKELEVQDKKNDVELNKDKGNLDLQKKKSDIKLARLENFKSMLDVVNKLKWWIIGAIVVIVGWKKLAKGPLKSVVKGDSALPDLTGSDSTNVAPPKSNVNEPTPIKVGSGN